MKHAAKHAAPEEVSVETKWYSSTVFIVPVSYTHLDVYKRQQTIFV